MTDAATILSRAAAHLNGEVWIEETLEYDADYMPHSSNILSRMVLRLMDLGAYIDDIQYSDLKPISSAAMRELASNGPRRTFRIHVKKDGVDGVVSVQARNGHGGRIAVTSGFPITLKSR